ncbi:MAG: PilZ domain-containing protein [Polyangiaceae bacterium]|nr:PilZ domain-containing protein [Polyangiaceae bacterium]NUQ77204.1 PilZ domain-containing protein [Polyangiaceae bacterium]
MSNRGAEGSAAKTSSGERRTSAPQRVHFEALVAMADENGGTGFEAESVDVSAAGMRLRTAYLPPIGEKLVCRFDGAGSEISATGEVIWRNELARGGEFGVRFTELDRETESALRAMCTQMAGPEAGDGRDTGEKDKGAPKGTRVRLHIEGLGSPMKARVRESDSGEVLVGSNLEFLRVGRSLELEDVDQGVRREAHIDHVKVDIDPETHIPQLVVSLRYNEEKRAGKAAAGAVTGAAEGAMRAAGATTEGETRPEEEPRARTSEPRIRPSKPAPEAKAEAESAEADAADQEGCDEERSGQSLEKIKGIGTKAAAVGKSVAGKVGPSLSAVSAKTKGAVLGLVAALQKKRAERAEAQQASAPRRMTAPPPTGALRPQGRKLVRDENGSDDGNGDDETPLPPRMNKRAAVVGSALGLFAVLAVFGMTRFFSSSATTSADGISASADGTSAPALTAAPAATDMANASPSGMLTAEVPLFGATPLSTTEPVPSGLPDPAASAGADPLLAGMPPSTPSGDLSDDAALDDPSADGGEDSAGGGGEQAGSKEYGQGKVRNPIVLRIKMDGPVETLNGAAGAMGFTISMPGRRSLSSSSELARKDKRIASLQVVNNAHGAEVTVQFKDGIPAYRARAKGDKLEIALGTAGLKKVASKSTAEKKKATTSKKKVDAKKKASKKKDAPKKDAKKAAKKKASSD